jgi:Kelch motif
MRAAGALTTARTAQVSATLPDGRILVAGGYKLDEYGAEVTLASSEVYDVTTDRWSEVADLRQARSYASATLLQDGRVLVVGGRSGQEALASAELFSPPSAGAGAQGGATAGVSGCGCRSTGAGVQWLGAMLSVVLWRRRRRSAH